MLGIDYEQMKELEEDARLEDCDTCGSDQGAIAGVQCLTCGGPVDVPLPAKKETTDNEPSEGVQVLVLDQEDIAKMFEENK